MRLPDHARWALFACVLGAAATPSFAQDAVQAPPAREAGQPVRITGVVRDQANAIALPGVPVEVVGTGQVVHTDVDGRYVLDLSPGTHEIRILLDGYEEKTVRVEAARERQMSVDVGLSMMRFSEAVTVSAAIIDVETSSAEAQLIERKQAQVITDNLGASEMKRNGDGDASAAMQRVTGLSVVDDFVFVRGLGERYSNTTLNGAVIPTTEPDRKVVPLDLFPAGLIDNVQVAKSYVPDRSAEFAGGLVQIEPLRFPTGPTVEFSYGIGFNSRTTGEQVLGSGGGQNWFGFDDGGRDLPSLVPNRKVIRGGRFTPDVGMLRSELERVGEAFSTAWTPTPRTAKPAQNVSAVLGDRFGKLGLLGSYTQSYREQFTTEDQTFYRSGAEGLSAFSDYDFVVASTRASVGGIVNVAYQFMPTQRLSFENFYTHTGRDEARTFEGFNSDIDTEIRDTRQYWIEEELLSNMLSGEHFMQRLSNSLFDWRVSRAVANRDEPDLRETLYENNAGDFVLADESQSGFRMFSALEDRTIDAAANWSTTAQMSGLPVQIKFGGSYVERERDFASRRFRFVPLDVSGLDLTRPADQLLTAGTIGPNFELKEETRVTDAYEASQSITAVYGMTDLSLSARARLVAGARLERFDQQVDTFDPFDFEGDPDVITASLENTDVFPSVNFIYTVRPDQNLRIGFSQTVNRPEFRELAPYEFTDIVGGRAVVGNADLQRALIQNVDARWELFPGGDQVLPASLFYKHFSDPIERIVEPTAQLRTSFTNAEAARNVGLEIEGRRRFGRVLMLGANYTWVNSEITLTPAAAQVQTSLERPLAGQSENLFNMVAEVGGADASVRLLYNFFGERISDVGSLGLPDILEDGRGSLDLAVSGRYRALRLRFTAENLTDEAFTFTQGGLQQRRYTFGRSFAFNVGVAAF
jgi:TonB dependent receptor/CarboxypepD_reg-like domain/TonB-dependent Receptor Plug Domain